MLDANHFRQKATRAREMAQSGDDIRLSRMLLEVALDLDAEAAAIEAEEAPGRTGGGRPHLAEESKALLHRANLHSDDSDTDTTPIEIINLSLAGVKFRTDRALTPGSHMILELPNHALRLDGTIVRACGKETAMVFDPSASADPGLTRLLEPQRLWA